MKPLNEDISLPQDCKSQPMEMSAEFKQLEVICEGLLTVIGEDPKREGLLGTPKRFAKFWMEFMNYDPGNTDVTFESIKTDQMVVVSGLKVWSLCEHHLLPFWSEIAVGYLSGARVIGLSKIARIAHKHAHKLQIQERLVNDIAEDLARLLDHDNVAVMATGRHTCMEMRGIKTKGFMTTSIMRGVFLHGESARNEFLSLARLS